MVPTAVIYNNLVDVCCYYGDLEKPFGYRNQMEKKGIMPIVSTYNTLIHKLLLGGRVTEIDDLSKEMKVKKMVPDKITYDILML